MTKQKTMVKEVIEEQEGVKQEEVKEVVIDESALETQEKKEITIYDIPGVGTATAEKLSESGYDDLMSLAVATPGEVVDASGVTETTARKMINFCRNSLDMGFESGDALLAKRAKVMKIKTEVEAFDQLMGGGFETGAITECFGQYGSAKTQIAHWLAVQVQKLEPNVTAIYVDTENTFRPERIIQFAKGAGLDPDEALKNIKVARAYNSDHQMLLAEKIGDLIKDQSLNVRLVVVDSLTAHFRAEFVGRGTLAERQQKLNKHMHTLIKLADSHNLCIYVTNQVMSKPDQFFGDPTEAIGGNIVAHNSTFRLYLRRGKKGSRVAKLVDSPNLPEGEAVFLVQEEKIADL